MSANRVGYRGYVTSRPFGGLHIPVPVQALVLRDYCARNGYLYKLHANENVFPNSYMVLEGMINELDRYEGLLATSMFMMPKRAERRRKIYDAILEQGASLHFVLEDVVCAIRRISSRSRKSCPFTTSCRRRRGVFPTARSPAEI